MNKDTMRQELFLLVGYLLTSAHGLFGEPKRYGPFRLLDAAGQLLSTMETHGLADPYLTQLDAAIEAERTGNSGDDELRAALDNLCTQYAVELKRRVSQQEAS